MWDENKYENNDKANVKVIAKEGETQQVDDKSYRIYYR